SFWKPASEQPQRAAKLSQTQTCTPKHTGHIALILPRFARKPIQHYDIGIYRYLGAGAWQTVPRAQRRQFFNIGF
ncbi:MAG: hypothetical protein DI537_28455, partial [Stutzerimonas stutzeri]